MSRTIILGESRLDVAFSGSNPHKATPGATLLRAALMLGSEATLISEVGRDGAGNILIEALEQAGVDTHCIDRFTEGTTRLRLSFGPDEADTSYGVYPTEPISVAWPRINPADVMVYGGNYVLTKRVNAQLNELIYYSRERKAATVYVPDHDPTLNHRLTLMMPLILDCFESADITVVTEGDLLHIFGTADSADAFTRRVSFHCPAMLVVAQNRLSLHRQGQDTATADALGVSVEAVVAALARSLAGQADTQAAIAGNLLTDLAARL